MKDSIEVASVSDQQEHILIWLASFGKNLKWKDELNDRIQLGVMEAVANAMEHGNRWEASKKVIVAIESVVGKVLFRIEDEGNGYPVNKMNFNLPDTLSEGGRGLFLMQQLADELHFLPNGIALTFKWNSIENI